MEYNEFINTYEPVRNELNPISILQNTLFENDGDEQIEFVEQSGNKHIWSYDPRNGILVNGIHYSSKYLGYVVCKKPFNEKHGTVFIKV